MTDLCGFCTYVHSVQEKEIRKLTFFNKVELLEITVYFLLITYFAAQTGLEAKSIVSNNPETLPPPSLSPSAIFILIS